MSKVLLVLVVLVGAAAAYVATRPDAYHVERSASIEAPAATVFAQIDDLSVWKEWSPWEKKDPAMKRTLSATPSGVGATYAWQGDGKAGAGRMEIAESTAPSRVGIVLDFEKPIANRARTTFTLSPHGDATLVTWTMESPNRYLVKVMHLFFDAEQIVGDDFARGLADLKAAAEKS